MNDDFLRQLRPKPRAAFVHELKAKLDRQPHVPLRANGPAYLRTLLVALLLGGAAFAVTMLSKRHEPAVARVGTPTSSVRASVEDGATAPPVAVAADSQSQELAPVVTRAVRHNSVAAGGQGASAPAAAASRKTGAASDARGAADEEVSPVVVGVAEEGEGIRWIRGAGSEFPAAVYAAWSKDYLRATRVSVSYDWTGNGGGVKLLKERDTAFAAVDVPLEAAELKASGLFQFPILIGAVVPIVHLPGVKPSQLALDGPTLARIYLGEIANWSDPAIQKLNPGLALPNTRITLLYRLDTASSTRVLTEYLAQSSPWFKARYGVASRIDVSPGAAARGSDGMVDLVGRTDGAIGYVDYLYAKQHGVESIRLINKEARVVAAAPESLQSAAMHADWLGSPEFDVSLIDRPGDKTWPMAMASFVVMPVRANRRQTAAAVLFFDWAYRKGARAATELGYETMPPAVADRVRASWAATLGKGVPPADTSGK